MNKKRILIVDDDPDIRLLIDFHLSSDGYEIIEATDGAYALDVLRENPVDLIITDLRMPNMNGYELIRNLKESQDKSGIPVLLLTGSEEESVLKEGMLHKPDDVLSKPFSKEDLHKKIEKLLL